MSVNNILKQFNSFSKRIEAGYFKQSNSHYNTNYDLVDDKGKIIHSARRATCFTKITTEDAYKSKNWIQFGVGQKLYVYALSQDTSLSESDIKRYLNFAKKLGLSFKLHVKEDYDLNYMSFVRPGTTNSFSENTNLVEHATKFIKGSCSNYDIENSDLINSMLKKELEYDQIQELPCFKRQKVYILEIDLNVHKTMATVKLLLYLFRFIYEFDYPICVKKILSYKSKYPKYDFITILCLMNHYLYNSGFKTGHNICAFIKDKITTKSTINNLKNCINKELEHGYSDTSITEIFNFNIIKAQVKSRWGNSLITINKYVLTEDISIDKFFNDLMKETDINKLVKSGEGYTLIKVVKY